MAKRWQDLSSRQRKLIVTVGLVESALKVAMLVDLKRRQDAQVRGSRRLWALSALVNSAGILPLAYFLLGRVGRRALTAPRLSGQEVVVDQSGRNLVLR